MPAARYAAIRDRVVAGNDQFFSEPVRLLFLSKGKADPNRQPIEIMAILRTKSERVSSVTGQSSDRWQAKIAAGHGFLAIDRTTYGGPDIRSGDKVCALSRSGQPVFEIQTTDDRSHVRFIAILGDA